MHERAQRERIRLRRTELECGEWTGIKRLPPFLDERGVDDR